MAEIGDVKVTVEYDLNTVFTEEKIRDKLMELGWAPPIADYNALKEENKKLKEKLKEKNEPHRNERINQIIGVLESTIHFLYTAKEVEPDSYIEITPAGINDFTTHKYTGFTTIEMKLRCKG